MTTGSKPVPSRNVTGYYVDRSDGSHFWHFPTVEYVGRGKVWSGSDYPGTAGPKAELPMDKDGNILWAQFVAAAPKPPIADHPYTCQVSDVSRPLGTFRFPPPLGISELVAVPSGSAHHSLYDPEPEMRITLAGKLHEKLSGASWNAGVFVAEAPKALEMISQSATSIVRLARAVKKADVAGVVQALGPLGNRFKRGNTQRWAKHTVAGRWLELQYGWLPLLSDIKGGAEFLAHHFNVPQQLRIRVRTKRVGSFGLLAGCTGGEEYVRLQVVAVMREPPSVYQLAGLTDPLSVAWELLPFSFVADWILPVGDWLAARNTMSILGSNTYYVVTRSEMTKYAGRPPDYPSLEVSFDGSYGYRYFSMVRTIESNIVPVAPRLVRLDQVFPVWARAANAIALLQSVFGRK